MNPKETEINLKTNSQNISCFEIVKSGIHPRKAIPNGKGTYILFLQLKKTKNINIGKQGKLNFQAGHYLYIGSAFGPGGLFARVGRHQKRIKVFKWHIDYLRYHCKLNQVWFRESGSPKECNWAELFSDSPTLISPHKNIGSSDCRCFSHLFYSRTLPSDRLVAGILNSWNQ